MGTSPFTKKCYCHIAQRLRHIGGEFRKTKTREEGAPVSCLRTGGQMSLHHCAKLLGICFKERGRGGARDKTWALGWA